jgi:hypothetical protein
VWEEIPADGENLNIYLLKTVAMVGNKWYNRPEVI